MSDFPWEVVEPVRWGDAPAEMSFSMLKQIEACPRRVGLERGEYSQLSGRYPSPIAWGALRGTVIHGAIEQFARVFRSLPADTDAKARSSVALRQVGGLTALAKGSVEAALSQLAKNPRCAPLLSSARAKLTREVPQVRAELAVRLEGLNLPVTPQPAKGSPGRREDRQPGAGGSGPPGPGVYPELHVKADEIGWKGTLDMLVLSGDGATILEFKTGERKPEHGEQLRCYAVIWRLEERNPTRQPPSQLTLVYRDGKEEVPALTEAEATSFQAKMVGRKAGAEAALREKPPRANVSSDNCRWCGVRHLCGDYWKGLRELPGGVGDFVDVEVELAADAGPGMYQAIVRHGPREVIGRAVMTMFPVGFTAPIGTRLRLLGARWAEDEDAPQALRITAGQTTELFFVR